MQAVELSFNYPEDDNLHLVGMVKFANDFPVAGVTRLKIRGLGEWRRVKEDTIHVSHNLLNSGFLTAARLEKLDASGLRVEGLKTNKSDIQLSFAIREKGVDAVIKQLTKFFKTLNKAATVMIEEQK